VGLTIEGVNVDCIVVLWVLKKLKNNGEFFESTSWKDEQGETV